MRRSIADFELLVVVSFPDHTDTNLPNFFFQPLHFSITLAFEIPVVVVSFPDHTDTNLPSNFFKPPWQNHLCITLAFKILLIFLPHLHQLAKQFFNPPWHSNFGITLAFETFLVIVVSNMLKYAKHIV